LKNWGFKKTSKELKSIILYMNRGLNKLLNDIVLKELPLSNKYRTVSHRVLVSFSKIISGRNNELKQQAITQY